VRRDRHGLALRYAAQNHRHARSSDGESIHTPREAIHGDRDDDHHDTAKKSHSCPTNGCTVNSPTIGVRGDAQGVVLRGIWLRTSFNFYGDQPMLSVPSVEQLTVATMNRVARGKESIERSEAVMSRGWLLLDQTQVRVRRSQEAYREHAIQHKKDEL